MRDEVALQSTLSLVIGRLEDFAKRVHDRMTEVDWLMQRELIRTLVKQAPLSQFPHKSRVRHAKLMSAYE